MIHLSLVPAAVVFLAVLIAAVTDVWKYRVYNALTIPVLLSGLIYHGLVGGRVGLSGSLLGVLFGFVALIVFYVLGGMGAGDVKLMAAIGAWLGMPLTFYVLLASALAAGIYAAGLLIVAGGVHEVLLKLHLVLIRLGTIARYLGSDDRIEKEIVRPDHRRRLIPFAAIVAVGVISVYFLIDFM